MDQLKIGVLAMQGDFREHVRAIETLGATAVPVRLPEQLADLSGVIIPGGESTVMGKLITEYRLVAPLRTAIAAGLPAWGTCAGMILLASATENALAGQPLLAAMDIHVNRNAFGTQRESFATPVAVPVLGDPLFPAIFIRAPAVLSVGPEVEVLAQLDDAPRTIVAVRQRNLLATAFHPEISGDLRFHAYFIHLARQPRSTLAVHQ